MKNLVLLSMRGNDITELPPVLVLLPSLGFCLHFTSLKCSAPMNFMEHRLPLPLSLPLSFSLASSFVSFSPYIYPLSLSFFQTSIALFQLSLTFGVTQAQLSNSLVSVDMNEAILVSPPPEVFSQGLPVVFNYLKALAANPVPTYRYYDTPSSILFP